MQFVDPGEIGGVAKRVHHTYNSRGNGERDKIQEVLQALKAPTLPWRYMAKLRMVTGILPQILSDWRKRLRLSPTGGPGFQMDRLIALLVRRLKRILPLIYRTTSLE